MAVLLSIEHSQRDGGVAVSDVGSGELLARAVVPRGGRHQVDLMVQVRDLLAEAGAGPADLKAVAVALGPGGFTGLRVAVATAKALCWSTGAALLAVPTLALMRAQHPDAVVGLNVKFDEAWSAGPGALREPAMRPVLLLREAAAAGGHALVMDKTDDALPVEPDVAVLARLGLAALRAGELADVRTLEPLYIRETEAERKWRERAGSSS